MKLLILNKDCKVHVIYENVADVTEVSVHKITWRNTMDGSIGTYDTGDPSYPIVYLVVEDTLEIAVGDPAPAEEVLEFKKERKIRELDARCNEIIFGGVTVASTGNQYSTAPIDLQFLNLKASYLSLFPDATDPFLWKTLNNGKVEHTVEQFKEVCQTVHDHLTSTVEHYWSLENQVKAAKTIEEVEDIQW